MTMMVPEGLRGDAHRPKIFFRQGSHAAWSLKNPILGSGEPIYVTDKQQWKLGDGVVHYLDLPFKDEGLEGPVSLEEFHEHVDSDDPHPNYDDGRSFVVYYENAKV